MNFVKIVIAILEQPLLSIPTLSFQAMRYILKGICTGCKHTKYAELFTYHSSAHAHKIDSIEQSLPLTLGHIFITTVIPQYCSFLSNTSFSMRT